MKRSVYLPQGLSTVGDREVNLSGCALTLSSVERGPGLLCWCRPQQSRVITPEYRPKHASAGAHRGRLLQDHLQLLGVSLTTINHAYLVGSVVMSYRDAFRNGGWLMGPALVAKTFLSLADMERSPSTADHGNETADRHLVDSRPMRLPKPHKST
jgi:hypothetical protein